MNLNKPLPAEKLYGCDNCDAKPRCRRKIEADGQEILAKEAQGFALGCAVRYQDVCRDCTRSCKAVLISSKGRHPRLVRCPSQFKEAR